MSDGDEQERPRGGRTAAEWTTLAVSSAVLAVVVALIVGQLLSASDPAAPRAAIGRIEAIGNRYRVHVMVKNDGDETAANVQITAALGDDDGDLSIDFLAGGEEHELVFLFDDDPRAGDLTVAVSGYEDP